MPTHINLTGRTFGALTVRKYLGGSKWACACVCGGSTTAVTGNLRSGNSQSCGCRKRAVLGESTVTHGWCGTPTYRSWKAMRTRCKNPSTPAYKNYGGRGITVCERWLKFENFLADMGERQQGHSLERKDNNKGYRPDNCVWATPLEQGLNTRTTRRITWQGTTMSMSEWAKYAGHHPAWLHKRLARMPMDAAMVGIVAPITAGESLHFDME
jgi:hypothetical protein